MEFIDWRELYAANRAVIEGRNVPADPDVIEGHAVAAGPTTEGLTMQAVGALYGRPDIDAAGLEALAEVWRPYRMWAVVLLRVAWGRSAGPTSYRSG